MTDSTYQESEWMPRQLWFQIPAAIVLAYICGSFAAQGRLPVLAIVGIMGAGAFFGIILFM